MRDRHESTFFHPLVNGSPNVRLGVSPADRYDNSEIADRLLSAFNAAAGKHMPDQQSLWSILERSNHARFIDLLRAQDRAALAAYLTNIFKQTILYGIDQGADQAKIMSADQATYASEFMDRFVRLAEAFGLLRVENPEQGPWGENLYTDPDLVLDELQRFLGVDLRPPEVAEGRIGLATKNGLFAYRDISAIYTAYRLKHLLSDYGGTSICEIGGGFGKVAYYAHLMGVTDYTIIDLPQVSALQGFYLMRALPRDSVVLFGEPERQRSVKIYPNWLFAELPDRCFDLILNEDSMPELGHSTATTYMTLIRKKSRKLFFSLNQESENVMTTQGDKQEAVFRIARRVGGYRMIYRFPFWLRNGYTEELYSVV